MSKSWLVTGSSRGLGRAIVAAALERGDGVVATARQAAGFGDLQAKHHGALTVLEMDVTDAAAVKRTVSDAVATVGELDIVVNNAGYGHFGALEELTGSELRAQLETNVFGVVNVTQAVLPHFRKKGSGQFVQVSSAGGLFAFPLVGAYNASKWALEGLTDAFAQEAAPLGISVTLFEPNYMDTDWGGSSAMHSAPMSHYESFRQARANRPAVVGAAPADVAKAVLWLADQPRPPLRLLYGPSALERVKQSYASRMALWDEYAWVTAQAD
jgi:NAD(P)-dependent dehydrogenase (short-subunit alcohol dehydrogenase family)